MLRIDKGDEPSCLEDLRGTEGANWSSVYGDQKQQMRRLAFEEQGGLCAYCMSRLSGPEAPDPHDPTAGGMTIEHFASRRDHADRVFEWQNLLGVCPGDTGGPAKPSEARFHCDTYRGSKTLHDTPVFPPDISPRFRYLTSGQVLPATSGSEARSVATMADITTLNLNHQRLRANRKAVLSGTRAVLKRRGFGLATLETLLRSATARDAHGLKREYSGVIAYYLSKKLRQHAKATGQR